MKVVSAFRVIALGAAFIMIAAGCTSSAMAAAPDSEPEPETVYTAVETVRLEKTAIRSELTYTGQVRPTATVNIASLISAEVTEINFDLGDRVEEGDVLFTVDAGDIQDQISQLQSALQTMNISVESAQYGLELAAEGSAQERLRELEYESGLAQASAGMRQADATRRGAYRTYEDLQDALDEAEDSYDDATDSLDAFFEANPDPKLYTDASSDSYNSALAAQYEMIRAAIGGAQGQISALEAQLDQTLTQRDLANISDRSAEISYEITSESIDAYREVNEEAKEQAQRQAEFAVRAAEAQAASTRLQLSIAQDNLNRAVITSPIGGVISGRTVEIGQMVSPAAVPFTIVQMDPVIVQVSVSEALINSVSPGDEVKVIIQALEGESLTGKVTAVSPVATAAGTFPIKIELSNPGNLIKPGMFAQAAFVEAEKNNVYVVNKNVVMTDETGEYLYVIKDGAASKTPVVTGLATGSQIEIVSGVTSEDEIVVVGQEYLYEGTPVNVVSSGADSAA